jgi:aminoglycoside 2'-N-acetyltransferase I
VESRPALIHTADLGASQRVAARALLADAFGDSFTEQDWEHALGGLHALVWDGPVLVGHASLIQRRLLHHGRALRTGYVEGVAVHPRHRGTGHGAALMNELERVVRDAYELGALSATEDAAAFYENRGWRRWRGATSSLTPNGIERTPQDDGGVFVLDGSASLHPDGELTCDWRDGDVW